MTLPNHLAGGTLITAIFSSLSGVNIFQSPASLLTMLIAATLPDIDLPKSTIGRTFKPIALYINRRWGHRTITHSLVMLLSLSFLLAVMEKQIADRNTLSLIFFYGYLSHLLLDMVTLMGVPLLYPFSKNPFVLPGNPHYRIRTGDVRAETIAFCLFVLSSLGLRPLFEQGFWTSYNRLFGTMKHLAAEFKKAEDMLEVTYWAKRGTERIHGTGLCIEAHPNRAILLQEDGFLVLDRSQLVIDRVIPNHTQRKFSFEKVPLIGLTVDSLNVLLEEQWIRELELTAETPVRVLVDGVPAEVRRFHGELLSDIWFQELDQELPLSTIDSVLFQPNPRIPVLRQRLWLLLQREAQMKGAWRAHLDYLDGLEKAIRSVSAVAEKERLYQQLVEAQRKKPPKFDEAAEVLLRTEIKVLQEAAYLKYQERLRKVRETVADKPTATLLSGFVILIHLDK